VLVSRRDAESQRCYLFYVFSVCIEASLSQRLDVSYVDFTLRLMCSYVSLCGSISRSEVVPWTKAIYGLIHLVLHASPYVFFCSFCGKMRNVGFSRRRGAFICTIFFFVF